MRAIFHPFEKATSPIIVTDEQAKHLQVVRIRSGEAVLVLNGKGLIASATVGLVSKNSVELLVQNVEERKPLHNIHLAIACPKKDAFEDILKIAVEMGVKTIQPVTSEFSQYDYVQGDRINRTLESALVQSNNAFLPEILPQIKLEEFLQKNPHTLYFFNSRPSANTEAQAKSERIILIGPEGGFSEREVSMVMAQKDVCSIHMPTPIQRAPTAVASSIGYLLGGAGS